MLRKRSYNTCFHRVEESPSKGVVKYLKIKCSSHMLGLNLTTTTAITTTTTALKITIM